MQDSHQSNKSTTWTRDKGRLVHLTSLHSNARFVQIDNSHKGCKLAFSTLEYFKSRYQMKCISPFDNGLVNKCTTRANRRIEWQLRSLFYYRSYLYSCVYILPNPRKCTIFYCLPPPYSLPFRQLSWRSSYFKWGDFSLAFREFESGVSPEGKQLCQRKSESR